MTQLPPEPPSDSSGQASPPPQPPADLPPPPPGAVPGAAPQPPAATPSAAGNPGGSAPPPPEAPQRGPAAWSPGAPAPQASSQWQPGSVGSAPPPGAPQQFTPAPPQPMNPRTKRLIIIWTVIVLVLAGLVTAGLIVFSQMNAARDPAAQVEEYMSLLEEGKAEAAGDMVDPGLKEGEDLLLTDEVMADASNRLEVQEVETVSRSGDGAEVRVVYEIGDEEYEHTFEVEHGPKEFLLLDTWELTEPLIVESGPISVWEEGSGESSDSAYEISVGGVAVDAEAAAEGGLHLYPGAYRVTAGAGEYFDAGENTLLAAAPDEDPGYLELSLEATAAFEEEILAQAQEYADGCISIDGNDVVSGNMDSICPSIVQSTRLSEMEITERPEGFSPIYSDWFSTDAFTFEVLSTSSGATPDSNIYYLEGDIIWEDGEPVIANAYFW